MSKYIDLNVLNKAITDSTEEILNLKQTDRPLLPTLQKRLQYLVDLKENVENK